MSRYVVLLRAVNVAGKNRIPMAELRAAIEGLGYSDVATYVQSGNIVLSTNDSPDSIGPSIQECISDQFGLDVTVLIRTANELLTIVDNYPYPESLPNQAGVVFMDNEIDLDDRGGKFKPDRFSIVGPNVYIDCPTGFGKTKLTVKWIERNSDSSGTRRNWKTVLKLTEMLELH